MIEDNKMENQRERGIKIINEKNNIQMHGFDSNPIHAKINS